MPYDTTFAFVLPDRNFIPVIYVSSNTNICVLPTMLQHNVFYSLQFISEIIKNLPPASLHHSNLKIKKKKKTPPVSHFFYFVFFSVFSIFYFST